ncbi:MAG: hypothetical protein VYE04_12155 [Pseudomonadota bacterium]|nr:hypothetical protein [Pseudomonadota bacterium]
MGPNRFKTIISLMILISALPTLALFRVPDTAFDPSLNNAVSYETKSLLMKFNYKTNKLAIGPYTGTWKNRKSSRRGGLLMRNDRKTSTEITLQSEAHGRWNMFCSGSLKGFEFAGVSFDRDNKFDYQCVMEQDATRVVLRVHPYAKPKFSIGEPQENRRVDITSSDGKKMLGTSIHSLVGTNRTTKKPAGYHISEEGQVIGGLGRRDKSQAILVADNTGASANIVFMSALGLQFFINNDLTRKN